LRNLPSDSKVPWHRIINSQGRIAFPEDSEKYQEQLKRLNDEGISMPLSKAKMRHYLWQGASVTVISKKPDNFQSESVKHSLDLRDSSK
jgi:pyruvate/2-oxoglutarate/acetoin dehydrogenase E1 component